MSLFHPILALFRKSQVEIKDEESKDQPSLAVNKTVVGPKEKNCQLAISRQSESA
jgi:hypothetical protein